MKSILDFSIKNGSLFLLLFICILIFNFCSSIRQFQTQLIPTADYFRVETFPTGDEISAVGGTLLAGNTIEKEFESNYEEVWNATYRAAMYLEQLSRKKIIGHEVSYRSIEILDKKNGAIQVGKIIDPGDMGKLAGIGADNDGHMWDDLFMINVLEINKNLIKVSIERKVVVGIPKRIDQYGTSFKDDLVVKPTTGNYERWILTQIDDDLKGDKKKSSIAIYPIQSSEFPAILFNYNFKKLDRISEYQLGLLKISYNFSGFEKLQNISTDELAYINTMINSFKDSLQSNAKILLESLGFKNSVQFDNMFNLTYPQKQAYTLLLKCDLNFYLTESYDKNAVIIGQIIENTIQDTAYPSIVNGKFYTKCQFQLKLIEPFSQELMWSSLIDLKDNTYDFSYKYTLPGREYFGGEIEKENMVYGEDTRPKLLYDILLLVYNNVLADSYSKLNPKTLDGIFKQTIDLRTKRKY